MLSREETYFIVELQLDSVDISVYLRYIVQYEVEFKNWCMLTEEHYMSFWLTTSPKF